MCLLVNKKQEAIIIFNCLLNIEPFQDISENAVFSLRILHEFKAEAVPSFIAFTYSNL